MNWNQQHLRAGANLEDRIISTMPLRPLQIRPCQDDEIVLLNDVEERAEAIFPVGYLPEGAQNYPLEQLKQACQVGSLPVACSDEGIVGFAVAEERASAYHLFLIAVLPEWGRQGIGRALLKTIIVDARKKALDAITLTTFSDLPWNAPYYTKLGFDTVPLAHANSFLRQKLISEAEEGYCNRIAMQLLLERSTI